jgi:NMD protein affecting ribosome stability and mRNA decay
MANTNCPNCGAPDFPQKEGEFCEKCGFKNTTFKKDSEGYLIFCDDCGFHRSTFCDDHPREHQKIIS